MTFQLIKNDSDVANLKYAPQLAIINNVAKKIGNILDEKVYHFETIHGHIVQFSLKSYNPMRNVANLLGFQYLADLEKNPWIRYVSIQNDGALNIHLYRYPSEAK